MPPFKELTAYLPWSRTDLHCCLNGSTQRFPEGVCAHTKGVSTGERRGGEEVRRWGGVCVCASFSLSHTHTHMQGSPSYLGEDEGFWRCAGLLGGMAGFHCEGGAVEEEEEAAGRANCLPSPSRFFPPSPRTHHHLHDWNTQKKHPLVSCIAPPSRTQHRNTHTRSKKRSMF